MSDDRHQRHPEWHDIEDTVFIAKTLFAGLLLLTIAVVIL